MTPAEFQSAALALLGRPDGRRGWRVELAERIGVDRRTIARWMQSGPPEWAAERMARQATQKP